jgi:hypothetical protein
MRPSRLHDILAKPGRLLFALAFVACALTGASPTAAAQTVPDSTLRGLEPMVGDWAPSANPPPSQRRRPPANFIVHRYAWTVGGKALRILEGFQADAPEMAGLDGMIYWNPATERIEFVAVAGHGPGEGRFFQGEYRVLTDGSIERVYDVFYRTLADMPGEELGGSRRRYREVYRRVTADSVAASLDWWRDGAWQPFGAGEYGIVRRR